jgi:UDP-2-acetamido-3-amino-2,3-dideoxy-glucuronate N-acetyltransferase
MSSQPGSGTRATNEPLIDPDAIICDTAVVGALTFVGSNVTVESNVDIGPGVIFANGGLKRTVVRSRSRIAAGAVIGPDVELGRGCEVKAGSVVLQSVPPNAIAEGNPAVIVGYTQGLSAVRGSEHRSKHVSATRAPAVEMLGVGNAALYRMKRISDLRGALTAAEMEKELPFIPSRYFIVFDVPTCELRGEHAHKECHQFLLCVRGSCKILLDDGRARTELTLDSPDVGVYMPPLIWGTQYRYTRDAALLVFASHAYNPDDYIRDYDKFTRAVQSL